MWADGEVSAAAESSPDNKWAAPAGGLKETLKSYTVFFSLMIELTLAYTSGVTLVFKKMSIWDVKDHSGTAESWVTQGGLDQGQLQGLLE